MKKALLIPVLALVLTACRDNSKTDSFSTVALTAEKTALESKAALEANEKQVRTTSSATKSSPV